MRFDLVVAGGGPAGAAAAIGAARAGRAVLLLERGRLPRHKVCGEFVSPEGAALLAGLLGPDAAILATAPRLDRVRLFSDGRVAETRLAEPALAITRFALDHALWLAARATGADCRAGVEVERVEAAGARWRVISSAGTFDAARVVDASGRWSRLSRAPRGPREGIGVGLKAHCSERAPSQSVDLYFFPGGYCGVQPIGDDRVNVCALIHGIAPRSFEDVWRRSPELERRAAAWTALWPPIATAPVLFGAPRPLRDGVLCAGDAAGFVDPFAGDGISLALASGTMAGCAPGPEAFAREYGRRIAPVFRAAAWLRVLTRAPLALRRAALGVLRVPAVANLAFRLTRPRRGGGR